MVVYLAGRIKISLGSASIRATGYSVESSNRSMIIVRSSP